MLPTIATHAVTTEVSDPGVPPRPHLDMPSRTAWALDHITHCPACGAWEMVTEAELAARRAPDWDPPAWCAHVTPDRLPTST